jgi:CubicO group peptidase (beta-lactamase class C family)/C-terminal processing protease CtpA/Prc
MTILALLAIPLALATARAGEVTPAADRQVENLAAFVRVYGYVRFFYPGDEAAAADWDKVAVFGAEAVRDAADHDALRAALLQVFAPLAPRMELAASAPAASAVAAQPDERVTFWQYLGLKLTDDPGPYRQLRVITGMDQGQRAPLFRPATPPARLVKRIAPDLVLVMPLALPVDADGKSTGEDSVAAQTLRARLASLNPASLTYADWRLRVTGIATVWNVFQHFYPYLDRVEAAWDQALAPALRRALRDQNAADYYATLSELVAVSGDGHGYVYGRPGVQGGIPFRVDVIEEKLVVTVVAEGAPFRKGDIIERIDGVPALEALRNREKYVSGSPHLRRFRALNQFGEGPTGSVVRVECARGGTSQTVEFVRTRDRRGFFFNSISEFEFPAFAEVRPGIFYVNLNSLRAPEFKEKLAQLANARGVIFDQRWDGRGWRKNGGAPPKLLQPHDDIIPHLIAQVIQASPMLIPQIAVPDHAGWTYQENTWPVVPRDPRFTGRIVFINDPSVVSYGETCMAMIANYRLATLVGAPTAGCNGNVGYIPIPGGFRVMWTGMDVRKHDRSPFYGVGFPPDVPVARTLRAVKEGRDECLEQAIACIESSAAPAPALAPTVPTAKTTPPPLDTVDAGLTNLDVLEGKWKGALEVGSVTLRIFMVFERDQTHRLQGYLVSPDQSEAKLPLTRMALRDDNAEFEVQSIGAAYTGRLDRVSRQMKGTWQQGGMALPLSLAFTDTDWKQRRPGTSDPVCPVAGDQAVTDALKPIRQKHHLPAVAGAIVTSKGVEICGVVGVRKSGADIPASLNDMWHLGSDTKAMTATLVGSLVEQGLLKWNTTVADVFPDLASAFDPAMRNVTLLHLLSHRAGLPANLSVWSTLWSTAGGAGSPQMQRLAALKQALSQKPEVTPGSKFEYSNLGYVIVGAMVEKVTGMSWEEAIEGRVFKPLEMKTAGFGGTGTPGQIDQPWGHLDGGRPAAANGPSVDNPPVLGPAGRVHCTIQDWAKFVTDQLRGARGQPALLKASTYQTLHTPPFGGGYGLGWIVVKRDWGGGAVLNHNGDNTMNCANVWIAPQRDFAVLVCINQSGDAALKASDEAATALIRLHESKGKELGTGR